MFDVSQENDTAASRTREALSRQMLKKGRKMGNYCGRHFPETEGMNDYESLGKDRNRNNERSTCFGAAFDASNRR